MADVKHTPGPWRYGDEDTILEVDYVQVYAGEYGDKSFRAIADVVAAFDGQRHLPLCDETRANAHLIAAAPTLLEALEKFAAYDDWDDTDGVGMMLAYNEAITSARAAIALAKGERVDG